MAAGPVGSGTQQLALLDLLAGCRRRPPAACLQFHPPTPCCCRTLNSLRGQRLVDAAVFEAVPFRSAIADGCTHLLVLCTRPARRRRSRVNAALADAMEVAIKKAVLSPDYMVPAWKVGWGRAPRAMLEGRHGGL